MTSTPEYRHVVMAYQTDLAPAGQGGGVRYVATLVDYLLAQGWEVTFLGAGTCSRAPHPGLNFMSVAAKEAPWPLFFLGLVRFLWRRGATLKGVIHVHRGYFALPFLLLAPNVPVVCTLHGYTLQTLGLRSEFLRRLADPFFRPLEKQALKGIERLISVDKRTALAFISRYPFLQEKMTVIPTTVDFRQFLPGDMAAARARLGLDQDAEIILCVGRLHPSKNLPFLLRVFSRVEQSRPRARLLVAGDGPDKPSLVAYADKLGLTRAFLLGAVPHQDMPALMQAADVLALTSRFEGSPIAVKEAVAVGLPVVATDVGDVRLIIKNKAQGAVTPQDEAAFYEALVERLEGLAGYGNAAQKALEARSGLDFAPEEIQEKIIHVYQEALGGCQVCFQPSAK